MFSHTCVFIWANLESKCELMCYLVITLLFAEDLFRDFVCL